MQKKLATRFIGYSFLVGGAMLWLGYMSLSPRVGAYFEPQDFAGIYAGWRAWIWAFRVHIFGYVISVIALTALASQLTESESRVVIWPGVMVASAGIFVSTLGAAFYYHHGAWGAAALDGKPIEQVVAFIDSLRNDTEYTTCLVRFGRVFSGLGLVLLGIGLHHWRLLPRPVSAGAILIGLASMALTMALPDNWSVYTPVFHAKALWLLVTGVLVLRHDEGPLSPTPASPSSPSAPPRTPPR